MNDFCSSAHMELILNPRHRKNTIKWVLDTVTPHTHRFDAIAVRGMSMALIAPTIADILNKNIILVRKKGDDTHNRDYKIEGQRNNKYIIIDDVWDSGDTIISIINDIKDNHCVNSKCVGIVLFQHTKATWGPNQNNIVAEVFGLSNERVAELLI
ncbi:hypothetical protein LCGC14_2517980 [marine sediment metagenome]|uniref:Phosphoribosyltransferase domain-containing protein n=1 Tax=marine sediment metagenome TaxID=412755 RepID=A0A0F9BK97_9ZZZZ